MSLSGITFGQGISLGRGISIRATGSSPPPSPPPPPPPGGGLTMPSVATGVSPFSSGSSYQFNGSNNGIQLNPATLGLDLSGHDWTIELFYKQTGGASFPRLYSIGAYPTAAIGVSLEGALYNWIGSSPAIVVSPQPASNTWHHYALVSIGGTITVYIDGVSRGSTASHSPGSFSGKSLLIGCEDASNFSSTAYGGYITNFRWTVGVGVYTSNFTVPTSALQTTQSAGSNISAITSGQVKYLMSV